MAEFLFFDNNFDKKITHDARNFLEKSFNNVIKKVEDEQKIENLKLFFDKTFYSHYISKTQLKIFMYKINEMKMKKFAEDGYKNYSDMHDNEKKEMWKESRKSTSSFLSNIITKSVTKYKDYTEEVTDSVIKIQKYFRKSLLRLLNKMEYLNYKLDLEREKALERAKKKTMEKRLSRNSASSGNKK
jgi:hypothetical protein